MVETEDQPSDGGCLRNDGLPFLSTRWTFITGTGQDLAMTQKAEGCGTPVIGQGILRAHSTLTIVMLCTEGTRGSLLPHLGTRRDSTYLAVSEQKSLTLKAVSFGFICL